ncbi:hypothetical protein GYMC52_0417 [Geobacillus sp. Y412MC52]|nr:hypothetical protein GYMC52_0417 [Geobacillus sp. Y412MC52]
MGQQLLRAFTTTILKKTRCFTNLLTGTMHVHLHFTTSSVFHQKSKPCNLSPFFLHLWYNT